MVTSGFLEEPINAQAALADAALKSIPLGAPSINTRQMFLRAVLKMLMPLSAALFFAERVIHSAPFRAELVQELSADLLPFERMADEMLSRARQFGYFDDPETAEPLRWLESCNSGIKDCLVALESMLDPELDELMSEALEEHKRGETVRLDSIR
jgi:hypothetical protein